MTTALITRIQEIIDEHKEQIPVGVVQNILAECQASYESNDLYKVKWTTVKSVAYMTYDDDEYTPRVSQVHETHTGILQLQEVAPKNKFGFPISSYELPDNGFMLKCWLSIELPLVLNSSDKVLIIHSIEKY